MRVLVTRPSHKSAEFASALRAIGAEAVFLPCIEIQPVADTTILDRALSRIDCYDWLVLTSVNAVDVVLERLVDLGVEASPGDIRLAAVGPQTAANLRDHGLSPDFVPQEFLAEAVLPGLGNLSGRWVLLPTSDIADDFLPSAILAADGIAHVITAYHTLPAKPDPKGLAGLQEGVDVVTFTSGSTVRNFVTITSHAGMDPHNLPGSPQIACIGPKTAAAALEAGFKVDIVPDEYTFNGLVAAIK
jgi:uroporphyrinogen III methyltransferase/synthase